MVIQWFPGHMAKTRRTIRESISQVDVVIELLDARVPVSSRNPEIDELTAGKPRIVALNKSDLSDPAANRRWEAWFRDQGLPVLFVNALTGTGFGELKSRLRTMTEEKLERALNKGRLGRPIRTMVVGVPNVGKSAFINRMAGKSVAMTGDKPGVTRAHQWVRINPEIQLLDTPGILWPKFDDRETGMCLAFTGAIRDDIMDTAELALELMARLAARYPKELAARFRLQEPTGRTGLELLEEAGRRRGCLVSGGEVDLHRIAAIVLDEFRGSKIGKLTLELPEDLPGREEAAARAAAAKAAPGRSWSGRKRPAADEGTADEGTAVDDGNGDGDES